MVTSSKPQTEAAVRRLTRSRLAGQFLGSSGPDTPADLVRALGAVQAQDYRGARWALGMRLPGTAAADIEGAFTRGEIIRTHVLRPTWHFVAPEDARWMLRLTAPRIARIMAPYNRRLNLDARTFNRGNDVIARALEGGNQLTRLELRDALLRARLGPFNTQRLAHVVMQAELDQVVCSGGRRGKQFTYALFDERIAASRALDGDAALREIALRYFRSRSPATEHDFAWWSGLTLKDARHGIAAAESELEPVELDGRGYWRSPGAPPPVRRPLAHLLPNYDEYFIGFKDRGAIGHRVKSASRVYGASALIAHVVALDGQLVGGWKWSDRAPQGVTLDLMARLTRAEQALVDRAIAKVVAFEAPAQGIRTRN